MNGKNESTMQNAISLLEKSISQIVTHSTDKHFKVKVMSKLAIYHEHQIEERLSVLFNRKFFSNKTKNNTVQVNFHHELVQSVKFEQDLSNFFNLLECDHNKFDSSLVLFSSLFKC